jgi:hypothetical protein
LIYFNPAVDRTIILRLFFRKEMGGHGQVAGSCKNNNEPPGSLKCEEFLD